MLRSRAGQAIPPVEFFRKMLQLSALFLCEFVRDLTSYEVGTHALKDLQETPIGSHDLDLIGGFVEKCDLLTGFMFLPATADRRQRLQYALDTGCFYPELGVQLRVLRETLEDEVKHLLVLHMPPGQAMHFYAGDKLLGEDVLAKFPQLGQDIDEAGKCFGSGRYTATVFHLMRVMEVGVQEFGKALGVSLLDATNCEKSWNQILEQSDKAIKAIPKPTPGRAERAEVSALLGAVRIAWRNEVMHPRATYTAEEAERILNATKAFMSELAKVA